MDADSFASGCWFRRGVFFFGVSVEIEPLRRKELLDEKELDS